MMLNHRVGYRSKVTRQSQLSLTTSGLIQRFEKWNIKHCKEKMKQSIEQVDQKWNIKHTTNTYIPKSCPTEAGWDAADNGDAATERTKTSPTFDLEAWKYEEHDGEAGVQVLAGGPQKVVLGASFGVSSRCTSRSSRRTRRPSGSEPCLEPPTCRRPPSRTGTPFSFARRSYGFPKLTRGGLFKFWNALLVTYILQYKVLDFEINTTCRRACRFYAASKLTVTYILQYKFWIAIQSWLLHTYCNTSFGLRNKHHLS